MEINVRPQVLADTDRVWDLLVAAFGDGGRTARLAEAGEGEIVGHVQLSLSWLDADERLVDDVLVLSPIGVAPDRQRQGVGRQLVTSALAEAERRGAPLVWLEGEPTYYPEFGFVRGAERGFRPPSARIPNEAFLVAPPSAWQPWMVGRRFSPDVFWQHDSVGPGRHTGRPLAGFERAFYHGHRDRVQAVAA